MDAGSTPAFIGFDEKSDFIADAGWPRASLRQVFFIPDQQPDDAGRRSTGRLRCGARGRYVAADDPGLVPVLLEERLPERDVQQGTNIGSPLQRRTARPRLETQKRCLVLSSLIALFAATTATQLFKPLLPGNDLA
jgi:hypothetical protein